MMFVTFVIIGVLTAGNEADASRLLVPAPRRGEALPSSVDFTVESPMQYSNCLMEPGAIGKK